MKTYRFGVLLLAAVGVTALQPISAQLRNYPSPPPGRYALVQAELDYLPAAERTISLDVSNARPAAVLQKVEEKSGLAIEVQGSLPSRPALSASYRDTETRVILEWLAREMDLSFRAEPPNTLWIIVEERAKRAPDKDAG